METEPAAETFLESLDPTTEEVTGRFAATPTDEIPCRLERARGAQADWAQTPLSERARRLKGLAEAFRKRRREIAEAITRENGKPLVEALFSDVLVSLDSIRWHSRYAPRILAPERVGHQNPIFKGKKSRLEYDPYGVVAIIAPWNYPVAIPVTAVAAALAAGNAAVVKPSELTPRCGALLGELFAEARLPEGLLQVVHGSGEIGQALIEALPDKVFFTGSVATGRKVAEECGRRLIPSVLELGGKSASIVRADADLDGAARSAIAGAADSPSAIRRNRASARCWVTRTAPGVERTACAVSSGESPTPSRSTSTSR